MQLLFVSDTTPTALLIRAATLSAWSHVAIVDGDHVIEAIPSKGVRRCTRDNFNSEHGPVRVVDVATPNDAAGIAFATAQIGQPYDWGAYLWWLLPFRNWASPGHWECSELATAALQAAGALTAWVPGHVSPGRLFDITTVT